MVQFIYYDGVGAQRKGDKMLITKENALDANSFKASFTKDKITLHFAYFEPKVYENAELTDENAKEIIKISFKPEMLSKLARACIDVGICYQEQFNCEIGIKKDDDGVSLT